MIKFPKKVPRFEKICCCIPLRGGVIFLVYFNLIISAGVSFCFGTLDFIQFIYRIFSMGRNRGDWYSNIKKSKMAAMPEFVFIVLILCLAAELAMSIVALVGLHKNRIKLLKIYLYYAVCMSFFMVFFRMFDVGVVWMVEVPLVLVYIGIKCHYIIAVRSQLKKLEGDEGAEDEESNIEMNIAVEKDETTHLCHMQSDINKESQPEQFTKEIN